MEKILVDSDILIDFLRTNSGFFPKLVRLQIDGKVELYISSITVFELYSGQSSKKEDTILTESLSNMKIIPFERELAKFAGEIRRDKKLNNPLADFIIGITAVFIGAKLATRNKSHFKSIEKIRFY